MADRIEVKGIVMASSPIGENNKRIVILTKELGKISAFAQGARRPGNHLSAAGETFAMGVFYLVAGRNSYNLVGADIKEYFRELTGDLRDTYSACYFLELADYFTAEGMDCTDILNLLYVSFKALLAGEMDREAVRYVYELKLLAINGEYPDFFSCRSCGTGENLTAFSMGRHGMVCRACSGIHKDALPVGPRTLSILQQVIRSRLSVLFSLKCGENELAELRMIMNRCMNTYVDKRMNSLDILNSL